jgi:hypothetical protein
MRPAHPAEEDQTCALRALTLCDGQQLEEPDHALTTCLCEFQRRAEESGDHAIADAASRERRRLLEAISAGDRLLGQLDRPGDLH